MKPILVAHITRVINQLDLHKKSSFHAEEDKLLWKSRNLNTFYTWICSCLVICSNMYHDIERNYFKPVGFRNWPCFHTAHRLVGWEGRIRSPWTAGQWPASSHSVWPHRGTRRKGPYKHKGRSPISSNSQFVISNTNKILFNLLCIVSIFIHWKCFSCSLAYCSVSYTKSEN